MKVAYVLTGSHISGGQRVVIEHVKGLRERGHEAGVILLDGGAEFWLGNEYRWTADVLLDVDVLVATSWPTSYAVHNTATTARKFYFVQMRESAMLDGSFRMRDVMLAEQSYALPLEPLTISQHLQDFLREDYGRDAPIIPNGVGGEFNRRVEPFHDWCPYYKILVVGSSHTMAKDVQGMAEKVLDKFPQIAGEDPQFKRIWQVSLLTHDSNYTVGEKQRFERPPQDMIPRLYRTADVVLVCSRMEGRPCTVVEALASGTPVVYMGQYGTDDSLHEPIAYGDVDKAAELLWQYLKEPPPISKPPTWSDAIDKLEAALSAPSEAWRKAQDAELAWHEWYWGEEMAPISADQTMGIRMGQFRDALRAFGLERDQQFELLPRGSWLDAGSGLYSMLQFLAYKGCKVTAIDPLAEHGAEHIERGEVETWQGEYDNVWNWNSLDHTHDWRKGIANLQKCVNSGGEFWLGTDCRAPHQLDQHHVQAFSPQDVLAYFKGWEIIHCNITPHSIRGAFPHIAIRARKA